MINLRCPVDGLGDIERTGKELVLSVSVKVFPEESRLIRVAR